MSTNKKKHDNIMHRNESILHCQEQIRTLRHQLQQHKRAWKQHYTTTALRRIGGDAWLDLSMKEQISKSNLLLLLQKENEALPYPLGGSHFWTQQLPSHLQSDKELWLARLKRPELGCLSEVCGITLPESLLHDRDVVIAAVRACPKFLLEWETLAVAESFWDDRRVFQALLEAQGRRDPCVRLFSVSLRSDAELMLEALRQGIRVFEVLPKALRNSKSFALQAAAILQTSSHKSYGLKSLKAFSPRLKADLEVVRAFCQADGTSLACASYAARRNLDIVRTACFQEPTAFVYCVKGRTRTKLNQHPSFWLEVLQRAQVLCECSLTVVNGKLVLDPRIALWDRLWENMPQNIRTNREIALLLLEKAPSSSRYRSLPLSVWSEPSFLLQVAKMGRLHSLPVADNMELGLMPYLHLDFCCQLVSHEYLCPHVVQAMMHQLPAAASQRRFWESWNPSQMEETLEFIWEQMPEDILNDKAIMIKFAKCDEAAEHLARIILWEPEDRDILEQLLRTYPEALEEVPNHIQELYPDLIAQCIADLPEDSYLLEGLHDVICEELWGHREVALAWIRKGGEDLFFLEDYFDDDEEIFLAVAEHNWEDFNVASESLLNDKKFLIQAVTKNEQIWTVLETEMKEDFDIALTAFAAHPNLPYYAADDDFSFLVAFARNVRDRLEIHDSFVELVLCSMDLPSSTNIFTTLNQGRHTTLQYKKSIAEYIGLPMGSYLVKLKKASEHLAIWGF